MSPSTEQERVDAALKVRERLDQAEAFIECQDMSYRWAEWIADDDEDSSPASGSES
jgi:hypothetical protein